jgi:CheY-like chemotaxis protein
MASPSPHIEEADAIRMVFQRLYRSGLSVHLRFGAFEQDFPIYGEAEDRILVGVPAITLGQWAIKPGAHMTLTLNDRGKQYEAIVEFGGRGELDGVECCHVLPPRILKCLNDSRLSDYVPEPPLRCTYAVRNLDILDGKLRALGLEGVELSLDKVRNLKDDSLRPGMETMMEITLEKDLKILAPLRVAHLGDGYAGLQFRKDGDQAFVAPYRRWLEEMVRAQRAQDQHESSTPGARAPRGAEPEETRSGGGAKILVDRAPLLLVISEGDAFPKHMAQSLGRKFGIAYLDYVHGDVKPALRELAEADQEWGRVKLLLVHQRLRISSGLELTRRLVQEEACPLPILVVGIEEDVALKRNRAIAAGAVDFISVEPFNVLKVMRTIEDTLKMFG